jgi:hypothetical protein
MEIQRPAIVLATLSLCAGLVSCQPKPPPLGIFRHVTVARNAFGHRQVGDIDGDGRNDIVVVDSTDGGRVVWYQSPSWTRYTIATLSHYNDYRRYRADDMQLADMDGDGDLDVLGRIGPVGDGNGLVVWWENPRPDRKPTEDRDWARHDIGNTDYIKNLAVADFNMDGKLDVAAREHARTHIFVQGASPISWKDVKIVSHHPHEGMTVADLDGDGDPDVILNGFWLENPYPEIAGAWVEHAIDKKWYTQSGNGWKDNNSNVATGDMNGDGSLDVLLSQSERPDFPVSWYSAKDPKNGPWTEHQIAKVYDYCQTLEAADFDKDGDLDVLAAEFPRYDAPYPIEIFWNEGNGSSFTVQPLGYDGMYHGVVGDVGSDGDLDIVGTRNYNRGPIEMWENLLSDRAKESERKRRAQFLFGKWTYIEVDNDRSQRFFGLTAGDVNGDGKKDIASGHYVYINPGGDMTAKWKRVNLPSGHDALLYLDVDGDEFADLISMTSDGKVYWLEARDAAARSWRPKEIGALPEADHGISSQGYKLVSMLGGPRPEIVLNENGLYYFQVPTKPNLGNWPMTKVATGTNEGIGYGDIDGDGLIDLVACDGRPNVNVAWYRNPGSPSGQWKRHYLGKTDTWCDRVEVADFNRDGRLDVAVAEETQSRKPASAKVFWFEGPPHFGQPWKRHLIVAQYTTNSMDVADMDGDGDPDLVTGEHRGSKKLSIWENDGKGNFTEHVVDRGKENHLGARVFDLDGDGDLDIIGIAWDEYRFLHLWRNDQIVRGAP